MPAILTKRLFGRKPQKGIRRLQRFVEEGKRTGYLGDKSGPEAELRLREKLQKMTPMDRKKFIELNRINLGSAEEGKIQYSKGDEAIRVTRALLKNYKKRISKQQ